MNFAHIDFTPRKRSLSEELDDAVRWYAACLWKNGQIADNYQIAWCDGALRVAVLAHGKEALHDKHHASFALDALAAALEFVDAKPLWTVQPTGRKEPASTLKGATSLYIETNVGDDSNRLVWRGDTHAMVPTYLLPLDETDREGLSCWGAEFRATDRLWIGCGQLELPAYRELAEATSGLNRDGRGLAVKLELVTGIPTYLSLHRYYGFAKGENDRRCPDCGNTWRNNPNKLPGPLLYEFRCRECHLISRLPSSVETAALARIGLHPKDPLGKAGAKRPRRT